MTLWLITGTLTYYLETVQIGVFLVFFICRVVLSLYYYICGEYVYVLWYQLLTLQSNNATLILINFFLNDWMTKCSYSGDKSKHLPCKTLTSTALWCSQQEKHRRRRKRLHGNTHLIACYYNIETLTDWAQNDLLVCK